MQIEPYTPGQPFTPRGDDMPKAKDRATEFGARLTTLRKAAGYTQVELATALGTTQRMIAYYESRAEKAPAALLPKMAEVLGVSADEILGIKPLKHGKSKGILRVEIVIEARFADADLVGDVLEAEAVKAAGLDQTLRRI